MFGRKNKNINTNKRLIRAGESATINSKTARGHKGIIAKRKKTGEIKAFTITHSERTRGRNNIPLQVNPQRNHKEKAYVVKSVHNVRDKNIGKRHPDIKIKNPTDKSVMRKLRTGAKKKGK